MAAIFPVSDETKDEQVTCKTCRFQFAIRELIPKYTIKLHGFEMHFCPFCDDKGVAHVPLIIIHYHGGFQGVRGLSAIPPTLSWRIGSGEVRFNE